MQRFILFFLIFFIAGSTCIFGQATISGTVTNSITEPIEFADVILMNAEDSTILKVSSTNKHGNYTFKVKSSTYLIKTNMISYQPNWSDVLNVKIGDNSKVSFILELESSLLDEVLITEEKNQMELKLDRRVFNVGKDLSSVGGNAIDILENLPSITVDIDGNVTLRGSENVRILINGKPSGLIGSRNQGLRQIQASMIERVEIITNPSARYEAEGEAGIINIVLKKQSQKGINGSIDLNIGYPEKAGFGLNLNRRKKRINLFTNLGLNYRNSPGGGYAKATFFNESDTTSFTTDREHVHSSTTGMIQMGGDYNFNKNTILTLAATYRYSEGNNKTELVYTDFNENGEIFSISERNDKEKDFENEIEFNLIYKKTFTSKEHYLDIDLSYQLDSESEMSDILEENLFVSDSDLVERSENIEDQFRIHITLDYVYPFGSGHKIETGLNSSIRNVDNSFLLESINQDGIWNPSELFNNKMKYSENIHASYFIYAREIEKWSYQMGLRAEYSDINTELVRTNEVNPRDYFNLFPSVHITYSIKEKNQFQVSYSRRISRPRYRHLIPYYSFNDNRNFWRGNPDLDPEFSHNIDLGYLLYFEKGSLLSSVYYRYKTDVRHRVALVLDDNTTEIFPINIGTAQHFGVELSYNQNITSWFHINGNLNLYRAVTDGQYEDINLDSDGTSLSTKWTLKFDLLKSLDAQTSFNYRAPEDRPQGRRNAVYSWDIGFSKEVFNKRGKIVFSIVDVLDSRKWSSTRTGEGFVRESEFQWRARSFNLGFNYLINKERRDNRRNRGQGGHNGNGEGGF